MDSSTISLPSRIYPRNSKTSPSIHVYDLNQWTAFVKSRTSLKITMYRLAHAASTFDNNSSVTAKGQFNGSPSLRSR